MFSLDKSTWSPLFVDYVLVAADMLEEQGAAAEADKLRQLLQLKPSKLIADKMQQLITNFPSYDTYLRNTAAPAAGNNKEQ